MGRNGGKEKTYYSVDQLRKKERKKELQKNKQQRVAQRIAITKNQDHKEILKEIEEIDRILFDPSQNPDANVQVLTEKRNKLRGKFHNMLEVYKKENDEEKVKELSKHEAEYLRNKAELMRFYEQIRKAQNVDINSISLPTELPFMSFSTSLSSQPVRSAQSNPDPALANLNPPGPPPGPPPSLVDLLKEQDLEGSEEPIAEYKTESVQNESIDSAIMPPPPMPPSMINCLPPNPQFSGPPTGHPSIMKPISTNSHFYGPRPPSGPIPSNIQRFMPNPGYPTMPPSGPTPTGWSSQFSAPQPPVAQSSQKHFNQISRPHQHDRSRETVQGAVVSAAPQRRNLIGEATAFMPTALMIKRGVKKPAPVAKTNPPELPKAKNTADDAFNAFMKDINTLL